MFLRVCISGWLLSAFVFSYAQNPAYNFRRVTIRDGLTDGVINAIAQDKYGYLWFGGTAGLNRYDGYQAISFLYNPRDSFSIPPDFVRTIFCDSYGNLWFGFADGLYRFDYSSKHFLHIPSVTGLTVNEIRQLDNGQLCLFTTKGLIGFDSKTNKRFTFEVKNSQQLLRVPMYGGCVYRSSVYVPLDSVILIYNRKEKKIRELKPNPGNIAGISKVAIDSSGQIWASCYNNGSYLYHSTDDGHSFKEITSLRYAPNGLYDRINDLYIDAKNRLWIASIWKGLIQFREKDYSFTAISNDIRLPNSLPENHINKIISDKQGFIWLGTEGEGVAYFHPDYNLFTIVIPKPLKQIRPHMWCRAFTEDKLGNWWMGTGSGLVKMNISNKQNELFTRNEITGVNLLHSNSIRSLLCDDDNNIWIGTSNGVNKYDAQNKKIVFYTQKDSLPNSFYWSLLLDRNKTLWLGSTSGLYYRQKDSSGFKSIINHPVLNAYAGIGVRSLFEDSRGNLWIGFNGKGVLLFDRKKQLAHYWPSAFENIQRSRIITSMIEDKDSVIWFASYHGLFSYSYRTGKFYLYDDVKTMESLQISCLQVDDLDRLWLATPKGLLMLDKERKAFKHFNAEDGLPDIQFNDEIAYRLKDNRFVYPTYDGFVLFDPLQYKEKNISANVFISNIDVFGKPYDKLIGNETKAISLSHRQNFFSIELTAFNYSNPKETWYAYKLDGFDKDWIYTKDRIANYTNVPGGHYLFRYKATSDPNHWNVEEKTLYVYVATVFYKTVWFWLLLLAVISVGLYFLYRNRMIQQKRIYTLQTKAQALEKEKAMVMYESLKQQLNPHFLFNSLTSLASLIHVDPQKASRFLDGMSKTYRYILKSNDAELVPLGEEIRFLENYILLQKTRFDSGLMVNINVEEEQYYKKIVPVTLQNLVENAIKHNIIDEESPLVIEIFTDGNYIVVRNNLQKKKFVETSNKRGLVNLHSLYKYLTKLPVSIEEKDNYFNIKIPLL
jgi:ligand-binding sensor domain-containing protein/sensor histidine kinase YesM